MPTSFDQLKLKLDTEHGDGNWKMAAEPHVPGDVSWGSDVEHYKVSIHELNEDDGSFRTHEVIAINRDPNPDRLTV